MQNLDIHEPVVDFVAKTQDSVLSFLKDASTRVADELPTLPLGPSEDLLAQGADLVDGGYALAEDLLARNRAFVAELFGVAKTLVAGFAADEAPVAPVKKTTTKKAA